jgi:CopG family nickel-responsive transcriptional regulator
MARFSVSLDSELLAEFDRYREAGRCATRSEAIRQRLRERLTHAAVDADAADVAARPVAEPGVTPLSSASSPL